MAVLNGILEKGKTKNLKQPLIAYDAITYDVLTNITDNENN